MRKWQRALAVLAVGCIVAAAAACDDTGNYGNDYGNAGGVYVRCGAYKTCGTCTPVLGCGWCATGSGTGTCTDGPDNCSSAPAGFSWEPTGCGALADVEGGAPGRDGGFVLADASVGADAIASDASRADASQDGGTSTDASLDGPTSD